MARAVQLTVSLENKPGTLAKLAKALGRVKVNIQAISCAETADVCQVRLVTDSSAKAVAAVRKAGLLVTTQPVLAIKLADEVGALAAAADKLAKAGININYVYGSAGKPGAPALIVLAVTDLAKADQLLQ